MAPAHPHAMEYGLMLPARGRYATAAGIAETAAAAERAGFASVWVSDHIALPVRRESAYPNSADGPPFDGSEPWLEPLMALTWVGAATASVRLGTAILLLPLRDAALVAKEVATLDLLTGGRVIVGVGAGWLREEFAVMGRDFTTRGRRLTEQMEAMRACWRPDPVVFAGAFHDYPRLHMNPKPPQGDAVPLYVGGHSPAALRRAATVGDGWIASRLSPADVARARTTMEALAREHGRPCPQIVVRPHIGGPLEDDRVAAYAAGGVDTLIVDLDYTAETLDDVLAQLEVAARRLGITTAQRGDDMDGTQHETTTGERDASPLRSGNRPSGGRA